MGWLIGGEVRVGDVQRCGDFDVEKGMGRAVVVV